MTIEATQRAAIAQFVRHELGCKCPDEVFNTISVNEHPEAFSGLSDACLIGIGEQLMVLLVNVKQWQSLAGRLDELFRLGRHQRDAGGFNRFRLVVVTQDVAAADVSLARAFARLENTDERLHLHVVSPGRLPDLGLEGFGAAPGIL